MLFGGIAHRRADHVAKHVDELEEAIEAVEDQLREVGTRAERPVIPGMPLPTGYGLQVRGPDNENIVLPVCLPPGFELDSMVLCPEFLPRDQPQPLYEEASRPSPRRPSRSLWRRSPRRRRFASGSAAPCSTSSAPAIRSSAWMRRSVAPSRRPKSRPMRSLRVAPAASRRITWPNVLGDRSADQERCRDHGAGDAVRVDELANDEVAAGAHPPQRDLDLLADARLVERERAGNGDAAVGA